MNRWHDIVTTSLLVHAGSVQFQMKPPSRPANPNRQVKVAIVTGSLDIGGAELMTLNLGRSLSQLGYDVTIVTITSPGIWYEEIERSGLRALHISGRQDVHPFRHAWRVGRRLRDEDFNVVVLTKFNNSERCTQAALNMLPDHVVAIPWIHSSDKATYAKALSNRTAWNVAVGVGVRVTTKAAERSKGKPVVHIPNGLVPPPVESLRNGRTANTRPFRLCFVGRMHQHPKGIFALSSILELCAKRGFPVALDLVGDGPDREELVRRLTCAKLMDRVTIQGAIPHTQVFRYLVQSHALLMPSLHEAMPCVPIEAQFCGCVPIVSNIPGVTDTIVDDGRTGFLVGDGVHGFVEAIASLLDDPTTWQMMSNAGQQQAFKKFTLEAMGRRFDQLIQDCLNGKYPLHRRRNPWLPVTPLAFTWREVIPRPVHQLGIGRAIREFLGTR